MNFTTTLAMLAVLGCATALDTYRVGPSSLRANTYEFGRPAALDPKDRIKA